MTPLSIPIKNHIPLSGLFSPPKGPSRDMGIVFAHGSSNDMNHPTLKALARELSFKGYPCLRFNFPYRERRASSPDTAHCLVQSLERAISTLKEQADCTRIIIAGKSLGARMAAQGTAAGVLAPDGLIFLGYPLHAPGRKDHPRAEPLLALSLPLLFLQGTRDPFCNIETLLRLLQELPAPKNLEIIQGGDHGFILPKSDPRTPGEIHQHMGTICQEWLLETLQAQD